MIKKIMIFLFAIILTSCNNVSNINNSSLNEDGSYVMTSEGIKSDFTNKNNKKILWYEDFTCPDCKRVHEKSKEYIKKMIEENKIEIKYYPLGFLDKYLDNEYSTRSASWVLGVVKYSPKNLEDFIDLLYKNEIDIELRDEEFLKTQARTAKVSEQDIQKIENDMENLKQIVSKSTKAAIKNEELLKISPENKFFVPFIVIDNQVLNGESENVENDIISPINDIIQNFEFCENEGNKDNEVCIPGEKDDTN